MKRYAFVILLLAPSWIWAEPTVSFHGFLAQGVVNSPDSEFIDEPDQWSLHLSETGINARVSINDRLQFVAQAVYLQGGNRYPEGSRLDYAFLDYALVKSDVWTSHVHIGRYKNLHWFYSATQDIPHTRPSAILPQSVYFDGFRDVSLSSDGVALTSTLTTGHSDWRINWSLGESDFSQDLTQSTLGEAAQGDLSQRFVHQFSVYWQPHFSQWQVGVSWLDTLFKYEAAPVDVFDDGQSRFRRLQLSARYSAEHYEITSEILREEVQIDGIPDIPNKRIGFGGYLQGRLFISPTLSAVARYDTYYADKNDRSGRRLEAQFNGLVPRYAGYMHTHSVGVRWDITDRLRLQAEHHWVEGAARLDPVVAPGLLTATDEHWRIVAVQLMTWF